MLRPRHSFAISEPGAFVTRLPACDARGAGIARLGRLSIDHRSRTTVGDIAATHRINWDPVNGLNRNGHTDGGNRIDSRSPVIGRQKRADGFSTAQSRMCIAGVKSNGAKVMVRIGPHPSRHS